jgi:hypothetical protein
MRPFWYLLVLPVLVVLALGAHLILCGKCSSSEEDREYLASLTGDA